MKTTRFAQESAARAAAEKPKFGYVSCKHCGQPTALPSTVTCADCDDIEYYVSKNPDVVRKILESITR
jgi:predicted nucleic-acid-binding Zn-ribbon protein